MLWQKQISPPIQEPAAFHKRWIWEQRAQKTSVFHLRQGLIDMGILRKTDKISSVTPFRGPHPEILDVYHKPAPACNYAQTATQCAAALSVPTAKITSIQVRCTAAAAAYPGCDYTGPFEKTLQAKMSIQFCVGAALTRGVIEEANYRTLDHPEINRLAREGAKPRAQQGGLFDEENADE